MLSKRDDAIPLRELRDLIGIMRYLDVVARLNDEGAIRVGKIQVIQKKLQHAYELALEFEPRTVGHYAAWRYAEDACRMIPDVLDPWSRAQPIYEQLAKALRGGGRKR